MAYKSPYTLLIAGRRVWDDLKRCLINDCDVLSFNLKARHVRVIFPFNHAKVARLIPLTVGKNLVVFYRIFFHEYNDFLNVTLYAYTLFCVDCK